ncbi:MAG: orotidine-5'-phosphate decarboxylase [Planctomycetota bacterium]|jgi:orotidine-5'-phosphate decarboxylase
MQKMLIHFSDRICLAVKEKGTPLIVGLDPVYSRIQPVLKTKTSDLFSEVDAVYSFGKQVLNIVAPLVPAVKINIAFFEKYLWKGIEAYYNLISEAKELGLQVIGDIKRGDIGHSAASYAAAHLSDPKRDELEEITNCDAVTVNGYTGLDGIEPFAQQALSCGKGIFVLVRTSNPSAAEIQDFSDKNGQKMYEKVAEVVANIAENDEYVGKNGYSCVGMVVGGTSPDITTALREKYKKVWFLVPGFGAQGAGAEDCLRFCKSDGTGALINASRSIIYAYDKPEYKEQFGDDWKRCVEQAVIDAKMLLSNAMQDKL